MTYTQQYTRPYTGGYKDRPDESTPEYAAYVNARDDALLRIEAFLAALNIPTKLSELVNDEGFIKNTVSNLANYYLKTETYARTETYTQSEVQALIADAVAKVSGKLNISVVDALPTSDISTTTFYLVPKETAQEKNLYDEYINTDGTESGWEPIGAVSTSAVLSDYYTKNQSDEKYVQKEQGKGLSTNDFSNKYKTTIDEMPEIFDGISDYKYEEGNFATFNIISGRQIVTSEESYTLPAPYEEISKNLKNATIDLAKNGVFKNKERIDDINSNLGGLRFGIDENGNYGYIKAGADTVTPFSSGGISGMLYGSIDISFKVKSYTLIEQDTTESGDSQGGIGGILAPAY